MVPESLPTLLLKKFFQNVKTKKLCEWMIFLSTTIFWKINFWFILSFVINRTPALVYKTTDDELSKYGERFCLIFYISGASKRSSLLQLMPASKIRNIENMKNWRVFVLHCTQHYLMSFKTILSECMIFRTNHHQHWRDIVSVIVNLTICAVVSIFEFSRQN